MLRVLYFQNGIAKFVFVSKSNIVFSKKFAKNPNFYNMKNDYHKQNDVATEDCGFCLMNISVPKNWLFLCVRFYRVKIDLVLYVVRLKRKKRS